MLPHIIPSHNGSTRAIPDMTGDRHTSQDVPGIFIRRAEIEDLESVYALLNDRQIAYWTAELPLSSIESVKEQISRASNQYFMLAACAGDDIIGVLTLSQYNKPRLRHVAQLSQIVVHQSWRGRGVGSELMRSAIDLADSWLNLVRLELLVYTDNEPAIQLYQKFGFATEGTMRRIAFRSGQYVDCLLMARVNDWSTLA